MTFRDIVIKNFMGSYQKYLAYFLSASFSIMLFFMYAALMFNRELSDRDDTQVFSYIFPITMVAIVLFSIFFINYAHSSFVKGRNKEFGIYISLGINMKEIRNLINLENTIINLAALLLGVVTGALFSRLFQMVVLNMLDIHDIGYHLNYKAFALTGIIFFVIFATVMIRTMFKMRRLDISSLLREVRKSESKEYSIKDPIFGGIGLMIMACSIVLLVIIANKDTLNSNPLVLMIYMITAFLGVYLTLSNGGNLLIHLIKKSRIYHKNMLTITQLHYKFNQNKKIIFILSVLSTMTIFLVASPFSLFSLSESIAEMAINHLEYVETATINTISQEALDRILDDPNVTGHQSVKFIYLSTKQNSAELTNDIPIMSTSEYNRLTGEAVALNEGEALNLVLDWIPGNQGIESGSIHELFAESKAYAFRFVDSRRGEWIAGMTTFTAKAAIVINDEDYQTISSDVTDQNIGYYHLINFKDWRKSKDVVTQLKEALGDSKLKPIAILDNYESYRSGYSVFLFISTVLGIMFFVAGGSVLYFKQFTELAEAKITFKKLFKIGITANEMKSVVGKELFIVFFLPLLFGTFLGVSLIYLMTYIVGGDAIIKEFLRNAFVVVAIYFVSQGIFYLITRNKYITEMVKS